MRRVSRFALVSWLIVSAGGCAAITGLDSIQEQDCAPNCGDAQATHDVTIPDQAVGNDSQPAPDRSVGDDSAAESGPEGSSSGGPETSTGDAPHDAPGAETGKDGGGDTGTDSPVDAPKDTGTVVDTGTDTGTVDSGCGATNTLQNCGACGQACAAGGTSGVNTNGAGCTGTTCLYQCATGHLDCNASVGYDGDGCECDTTQATTAACCGTACPIAHIVGTGLPGTANASFYDCIASGTYTSQLATDACTAYFGTLNDCYLPGSCNSTVNDAATGDFVVCGQTSATTECVCWEYQGPNVGKVTTATGTLLGGCYCPGSTGTGLNTYSWH